MKRILRILVTAGMLMALLLSFGMAAGEAKSPDTALPEIPVSISTRGTYPATPEEYTVRLTADDDFPMPEGSTGRSFDLKVTGPGPAAFPAIAYSRVGIYTYTMRMVPGTYAGAKYDDTVYAVKITVSNLTDGGFGYTTAIRVQGEEDKKNAAAFTVIYPAAKTQRTVVKVWDDKDQWGNENGDGIRPTALTVSLMRGTEQVGAVTLSAENQWTGTVTGLDRFETDTRTEIAYTWVEGDVSGAYRQTGEETGAPTPVAGGVTVDDTAVVTTITNSHTPETTSVKVIKQWDDDNDRDGRRPKGESAILFYLMADGEQVTDRNGRAVSLVLSVADGWEGSVDGLPKYRAGREVGYRWVELSSPDRYRLTAQQTEKENGILTTRITNRYETEWTDLTVRKVWDDAGIHGENQDGIRPATLNVRLLADGQPAKDRDGNVIGNRGVVTLRADSEIPWASTVRNLPVYRDQGQRIIYTWEEVESGLPRGYTFLGQTTSGNLTTFTNRHVPEETEITVRKIWDDQDNQDGLRTDVILRVIGQVNGQIISREPSTVIRPQDETSATFSVPVYYQGERITYTVDEDKVPAGYTKTVDNKTLTVTNSHTPWTIDIPVRKVWDDKENQDGFRTATSIALTGTVGKETVVTRTLDIAADAEGDALGTTFTDLPVRYQGQDIDYSVSEAQVARYEPPVYGGSAQNGFTVTNRHAPEKIDISGAKIWDDDNNRDGKRPESITVHLMADGTALKETTVTAENGWAYSFSDLDKYQDGRIIVYTLAEEQVDAYDEPVMQGTAESGIIITNTHTPETVNVTVSKIWDDAANQDGLRPAKLTVTLLADGMPVTGADGEAITVTLNEDNRWSGSVENLPKYKAGEEGHELVYSWAEPALNGYTASSAMAANGNVCSSVLTNRHETMQTVATVQKVWDDANNQDGIRPAQLTVTLLADGEPALDAGGNVITRTLSAQDSWTATVEGLDLNAGGRRIVYSWHEDDTAGYALSSSTANGTTTTLTNTHTPAVRTIAGGKVWNDADNQDGYRPETITVLLLADRKIVDTAYVSEETGWAFRFEGKPVYRDQGIEINYTVEEGAVREYKERISGSAADGFTVTNTHIPEETEVSVRKVWDDAGNQDGLRPASVTVVLLADGAAATDAEGEALTADLNEANEWAYTFRNLARKKDGKDIVYTVTEDRTEGYEAPVITGTETDGYTVTNTRVPSVMDLDVYKVWDDDDNRDGVRPAEITVTLLQNGQPYGESVTLRAPAAPDANPNIWTYHFTDLPVNTAGVPNVYTLQETPVEGYTGTIAGYTMTNTHTPATTTRTVRKVWAGDENMLATRPESVAVTLLADGAPARNAAGGIIQVALSAANGWEATVTDLPVYENGREITYRWREKEVPRYQLSGFLRVPTAGGETITLTNTRMQTYNLTVHYLYLDTGETAAPSVEETHDEGDVYDVVSPTLDNGYVTVRLRVQGVMPDRDMVEYVYYYRPDVIISDFETPLGLGQVFINIGDCIE